MEAWDMAETRVAAGVEKRQEHVRSAVRWRATSAEGMGGRRRGGCRLVVQVAGQ